jgi:hypothetical protein
MDLGSRIKILLTGVVVLLLSFSGSCLYGRSSEEREKAKADLERLCNSLPIPKELRKETSRQSVDFGKVVFSNDYRTNLDCDAVGDVFRNHFVAHGWDVNRMTTRWNYGGMKTLGFDFRDADYVVSVECQTDVSSDAQKHVGIYCSWGLVP